MSSLAAASFAACDRRPGTAPKTSPEGAQITSAITFVQVAAATPQVDSASVTVNYGAAQTAGNLNVVAVGWNDTNATVTSIGDTTGNVYARAVGPTMNPGALTQSIYYARNIAAAAAGANSVTVNFSAPAVYVDVRILEYSGADTAAPLDATAAAFGNTVMTDSGPLVTTGPNELLVAANIVTGITDGPGAGFTSRIITVPDGDIAEDQIAASAGTYHGTAPASGLWVMQMAAFRSAPVQPPTAPGNLTATAASTSQINLTWTASTSGAGIAGYLVERCQGLGCTSFAQVATPAGTSYGDTGLVASTTYLYRVRARDVAGNLSGYSNTASATTLTPPSSGVKFVQVAFATPQVNMAAVSATYGAAQTAGNLNFIAVGWNDATAAVTSVTDSAGNNYARAVGPTSYPGTLTQSIYYAKNIVAAAAGANSVTVQFSVPAAFVDLRILEYAGLDTAAPVDATAAAAGTTDLTDSGPLTTTAPDELLVAANVVTGYTSGPGAGFTSRVITTPDGDIVEDRIAASAGTYRGTAPAPGTWVMQMVAFRTATTLGVSPRVATFTTSRSQQFTATAPVTWSVNGIAGGSAAVGTITSSGLYTPPAAVGSYNIVATTTATPALTASATAYVTNYPGVFTFHNDNLRTGANLNETVLSAANVRTQFGPLFNFALDGVPHASPLYVANVNIPGGGLHNVVYLATEHDSVYAIDADVASSTPLWKVSFIDPGSGVTTVPSCDTGECVDISPEIGITGTPVIDPATGTLYLVAKTKEVSGSTTQYVQRLHALDIGSGAEKLGGPAVIQAQVNGTGSGTDGSGHVPFDPLRQNQREALALANGIVYIAFASHGDIAPWHGWLLGYSASNLTQVFAYNSTPNTIGGGFWQSGSGPGVDASGNVFLVAGNGAADANTGGPDFGDSFLKLSPRGAVLDWFMPYDQATFGNVEMGSGGSLLLPDQPGLHPHLMLAAGKPGTLYVVDRDNMGRFNPGSDSQIVQSLINIFPRGYPESYWSAPVVFQDLVYFGPNADSVQAFRLTNGLLSTAPVSRTSLTYGFPGGAMAISANGTANGILWCGEVPASGPGVLHAYNAADLAQELYRGAMSDVLTKFTVPTVANGKVYVVGRTQLGVFGLVP